MNINVPASELARMMRTVGKCIDTRADGKGKNIEMRHQDGAFSIAANNGEQYIRMSTAVDGGDGETACVDGKTFANVVGKCRGDVKIDVKGNVCSVVAGGGRTRIPVVTMDMARPAEVSGTEMRVPADTLARAVDNVMYAVSADGVRLILTGVLMDAKQGEMNLIALDGIQMSKEIIEYGGGEIRAVVPGTALKRFCDGTMDGETVRIVSDGNRISMRTDSIEMVCSLLHGEYIEYEKLIPQSFVVETMFQRGTMRDTLGRSSVIGSGKNLVRFRIEKNDIIVASNSPEADFSAEVDADNNGDDLVIAFNTKYLMNALNALDEDEVVLKANLPTSPVVLTTKQGNGIRLVLPVRVAET